MPATAAPHAHGEGHEHDDDLIVAPKGSNRLRFILTLSLILFVLIMFVVADLFQVVVGGGARNRENPTYLSWHDPVRGEDEAIDAQQFELTRRLLSQLASMGLYAPESASANDFSSRSDVEDSDVASFFVYEDLAEDSGIAISDKEHVDMLRLMFETGDALRARAYDYQLQPKELEEAIRRVRRVEKIKELVRTSTRLADPDVMVAKWQENHEQHQFQYAVVLTEGAMADATATPPTDEELLAWWHTQPQFEQQQLFSEEKTVPQVAWLDVAGSFDETALVTAFPRPAGLDEETLARQYYDRYRAVRFLNPSAPAVDPTSDPDSAKAAAFLEFEAVRDAALREAKIEAALADLIADIEQRVTAGASVDLGVEAGRFGLESFTSPDALTKTQLATAEGWGNQDLGQRLAFGPAGKMLGNVVINGTRMYLGRVIERTPRAEQPIDVIRAQIVKKWTTFRAGELTIERAKTIVAAMAEKPADHPEGTPWTPVVEAEAFAKAVTDAELTVVERPWLEQHELPKETATAPTDVDQFFQAQAPEYYTLPIGAVGVPKRNTVGDKVFIARHAGERPKPASELAASDVAMLPNMVRYEARNELASKVFLGDSEWFKARFKVRFPERERREAEVPPNDPSKQTGETGS